MRFIVWPILNRDNFWIKGRADRAYHSRKAHGPTVIICRQVEGIIGAELQCSLIGVLEVHEEAPYQDAVQPKIEGSRSISRDLRQHGREMNFTVGIAG